MLLCRLGAASPFFPISPYPWATIPAGISSAGGLQEWWGECVLAGQISHDPGDGPHTGCKQYPRGLSEDFPSNTLK